MKRNLFTGSVLGLFYLVIVLFASSCAENTEAINTIDLSYSDEDADLEAVYSEIEEFALDGIGLDPTAASARYEQWGHQWAECAEVTREAIGENQIRITLDFGEGCEGPGGHVRSGKIEITHTGLRWEYGSETVIELIDFAIDGRKVEGIRTMKNLTEPGSEGIIHSISLENGKMTFRDGQVMERNSERIRTWYRDRLNPMQDSIKVTGESSGMNRNGMQYKMQITEALLYKRECRAGSVRIPVQGEKVVETANNTFTFRYGTGDCDADFTVTDSEGRVRTRSRNNSSGN